MTRREAASSFARWLCFGIERKRARGVLKRIVRRRAHAAVLDGFRVWRDVVAKHRAAEKVTRRRPPLF